jgi:hypothetical protein
MANAGRLRDSARAAGTVLDRVRAEGMVRFDDARLDPAWIESALIPVLTDLGRIAAMSQLVTAVLGGNVDEAHLHVVGNPSVSTGGQIGT